MLIARGPPISSNGDMPAEEPVSTLSMQDHRDYEFILSDLQQNLGLSAAEQMDRFRKDPWGSLSGLRAPNGSELPLSREAKRRFVEIARRGLADLGTSSGIHRLDKVVEELKRELSALFCSGFVPGPDDAHGLFTNAIRRLEQGYEELTYHVPCAVVAQRSYTSFEIGPVKFLLRERFFTENEAALEEAIAEFEDAKTMEKLATRVRFFYSGFQWIASITVAPCDPEISRNRAHAGIQKALDAFKLVVGGERARDVKQAYDLTPPSDFAELVSVAPGSLRLRFGWKGQDAVTNDQWYDQLKAGPAWPLLQSVLLNDWNRWGELDEIELRFLDALAWHSDAISEHDPGARIIKFWTSIERTLRTSRGDIDTRAALLASDTPAEFADYSHRFEHAYRRRRNDVVHGNANRVDESWYQEAVHVSEEASKNVLYQYLYAIPHIRSLSGATDRKKIRSWLKELDSIAEAFRKQHAGV
jgi:hypothetical protein